MTILTHLRPVALALAAVVALAPGARAEMAPLGAEEMAAWAASLADIKAMTPKWGFQGPEAFKTSSDAGVPVVYLDVREDEERAKGVVEGAVEVSLTTLPSEEGMAMLPADKTAIIAVYCKSGHRSALAMPFLHRLGYGNAISMQGGYEAWVAAGYPIEGVPAE